MSEGRPPRLRIDVVTIFPEYLSPLSLSLLGKASGAGIVSYHVHDLRDVTTDPHRSVDDAPFGGGAGMLMTAQPWLEAIDRVTAAGRESLGPDATPHILVPTPAGYSFTQSLASRFSTAGWLVVACGRYEGIDERVLDELADRGPLTPLSIGDYVLAGGEVAALVVIEAVTRLLPGVLGNAASLSEESHVDGLLEYPAYTRPAQWRGRAVPAVLTSGDHARIARWRREQSLARTAARRPDLLARIPPGHFDEADLRVLAELGWSPDDAGVAPS